MTSRLSVLIFMPCAPALFSSVVSSWSSYPVPPIISMSLRNGNGLWRTMPFIFIVLAKSNIHGLLHDIFEEETSTVTRGHTRKLIKPRCNSTLRLHCFSHRVVNPWNSLTENVVSAPSVNAFKSRLDNHWKAYQFTVEQIVM